MSLDFAMSQTYHYQETLALNNNYCAWSQRQPQVEQEAGDSAATVQTFISNSGITEERIDYYNIQNIEDILNSDLWPAEFESMLPISGMLSGKSAPVIITDKEAAVVPDSADISFAYNDSDQIDMQDFVGQIISSSSVSLTADNQVAVVPSSTDSNNVHVPTHAVFFPDDVFPPEDITKRKEPSTFVKNIYQPCISLQSESTEPQPNSKHTAQKRGIKRAMSIHEVPTVLPGRKRVRKPLEIYNGRGVPQLWQFILQLLINVEHTSDVCWTHDAPFEFKFIRPNYVAELWGKVKGKANMNYEKLSRGIRYYYGKNIISKDHRKQHVYRFVCDIVSILGYDPTACPAKHDSSAAAASQDTMEETPKLCSTEDRENNFYVTQDQRNPFSFPKTEVNPNPGNAVFAFDGDQVNLFPSEFTSLSDDAEFQFSENFLETLQLQFPGVNALSSEDFV